MHQRISAFKTSSFMANESIFGTIPVDDPPEIASPVIKAVELGVTVAEVSAETVDRRLSPIASPLGKGTFGRMAGAATERRGYYNSVYYLILNMGYIAADRRGTRAMFQRDVRSPSQGTSTGRGS